MLHNNNQANILSDSAVLANPIQLQIDWTTPVNYISTLPIGEETHPNIGYDTSLNDGSITYVERILSEQGHLTFMGDKLTGPARIKSPADVAFLFKNLESAATENAFAVFIKEDGSYSVLYLGTGTTTEVSVDTKLLMSAAKELSASQLVFVHNHPSGSLTASMGDIKMHETLSHAVAGTGIQLQNSIIINLDSGKYVVFDSERSHAELKGENAKKTVEPKVYQFDRQVLYVPLSERHKISSSDDIAKYLSVQKRGAVPKLQMLVLSNSLSVNRYTLLDANLDKKELIAKIVKEVGKHGEHIALASNGLISESDSRIIKTQLKRLNINLIDVLTIKQDESIIDNYISYANEGVFEPEAEYKLHIDSKEEYRIIEKAKADGTYMLAPNGEPTNLNERQWVQVRTQAFKDWFGDWENDPENASKVVDENGEPMVVSHGTGAKEPFWVFKNGGTSSQGSYLSKDQQAFFFAKNKEIAESYAGASSLIIPAFINIKNPNIQDVKSIIDETLWEFDGNESDAIEEGYPIKRWKGEDFVSLEANDSATAYFDDNAQNIYQESIDFGNDGIIVYGVDDSITIVTLEPNQIKSATENAGTFDSNNNDIRFREIISRRGQYSDDEVSYENDPLSKALGDINYRSKAQRKAFAERERKNMATRIESIAKKLHLDNVEIVTDISTLDDRLSTAKGFYSKSNDKITIVIPNHISTYDATQTLLHEAVAHHGLRKMFGELFDTFLDNVFQSANSEIRFRVETIAEVNGWDSRKATEEYLAGLAENVDFENAYNSGWWQKIKSYFIEMMRELGLTGFNDVKLSDNELRYVLWRSYINLADQRYSSMNIETTDITKQRQLNIEIYSQSDYKSGMAAESDLLMRDGKYASKAERIEKLRNSEPVAITGNEISFSDDIKEYRKNANQYGLSYDHRLTQIEKGSLIDLINNRERDKLLPEAHVMQNHGLANKLSLSDFKDKKLIHILQTVNELSSELHTPVRVIENINEIPEGDLRKRGAKGWFDASTGEVVIVLPNAESVEDVRRTIFHEVVGHKGLRHLFGEHFDTFLDNVYANASNDIKESIYNKALLGNIDIRYSTEEYLAGLAERGFVNAKEYSFWQNIKDTLVELLRKVGINLGFELTDNDLRHVLWKSYQNLKQDKDFQSLPKGNSIHFRTDRFGNQIGNGKYKASYNLIDVSDYKDVKVSVSESESTESVYVTYLNENTLEKAVCRFSYHENNAVKFGDQLNGNTATKDAVLAKLGLKRAVFVPDTYLFIDKKQVKKIEMCNYEEADLTIKEIYNLGEGADLSGFTGKLAKGSNWLIQGDTITRREDTCLNAWGKSAVRGHYIYEDIPNPTLDSEIKETLSQLNLRGYSALTADIELNAPAIIKSVFEGSPYRLSAPIAESGIYSMIMECDLRMRSAEFVVEPSKLYIFDKVSQKKISAQPFHNFLQHEKVNILKDFHSSNLREFLEKGTISIKKGGVEKSFEKAVTPSGWSLKEISPIKQCSKNSDHSL